MIRPHPQFKTVDGATLMSQALRANNFIVDTLISQGLHVLAGASKAGKSWLALWLSVMIAQGNEVWGMKVKQGTTLYLALEDSTLRIQNRLFDITDDAPGNVHFCTDSLRLGAGLETQIESFIKEHPDTVMIIIDTLQMIRGTNYDSTYANDYRDLSILKKLADRYGIAILLIHHLRKAPDDDVFNTISGTTGIMGAADTCFVLSQAERGDRKASLFCIGRDIESRQIDLERDENNVWQKLSDSYEQPEILGGQITVSLSALMQTEKKMIGTPTEIAEKIDPAGTLGITPRKISKLLMQSLDALRKIGIEVSFRRSNGKRIIEITSVVSDDNHSVSNIDPDGTGSEERRA